jgi:hypothetical protein
LKHVIPDAILTQHMAVLGKTGSGKTSTAKLAIEQVVADGARVCVLDPIKSDWWGLTSSADGKRPGLPFHILGGPHGHVPVHASAGKAIAEIVATGALPLSIIDMADFEPGGQAKFFVDFAPALLRKMRGVVYLVIEEAHIFAPKERSGWGDENLSIHWAKTMATAGRSKGIRLVLVTQRTQALHNALLGSCDTLIAHRLTAPADQEPVVKWLRANTSAEVLTQVAGSLASLKTGEGWICSGEAKLFDRVQFPRIATYDNTATPTGDAQARTVKTAPVDQEKLRAIIGEAVDQAKADDPRELRKAIAEKDKRIKELQTASENSARKNTQLLPSKVVEKPVIKDSQITALDAALGRLEKAIDRAGDVLTKPFAGVREQLGALAAAVKSVRQPALPMPVMPAAVAEFGRRFEAGAHVERRPTAPRAQPHASGNGHGTLPPGELATLTAALQYPGLDRKRLTVLTGYKRSSRDAYIVRLASKGLIEVASNALHATEAGAAALPSFEPLPTGAALVSYWQGRLPEGERRTLDVLIHAGGAEVAREVIDDATGYKRSSRDAYLVRLKARGLVEFSGRGTVRASEELFS